MALPLSECLTESTALLITILTIREIGDSYRARSREREREREDNGGSEQDVRGVMDGQNTEAAAGRQREEVTRTSP